MRPLSEASRRRLAWVYGAAFMGLLLVLVSRHEMWRDEMDTWMQVRDVANPLRLLHDVRYMGHPALWSLVVWAVRRCTDNPAWMQYVNVLFASLSAWVLVRFAPFPPAVRLLAPLGYFLVYEYGVLSRQYTLGVLLLLVFCALYRHRWRRTPLLGAVLFLFCHTLVYGVIMSLVILAVLAAELIGLRRRGSPLVARTAPIMAGLAFILLGVVTGTLQVKPPADAVMLTEWKLDYDRDHLRQVSLAVVDAFIPVPVNGPSFWNTSALTGIRAIEAVPRKIAPSFTRDHAAIIAAAILCAATLILAARPWALLYFIPWSVGLLLFFYTKYLGYQRHHGFLYLAFLAALWISQEHTPWKGARGRPVAAFIERYRMAAVVPLLLVHLYAAAVAVSWDWRLPFSQAQATASWIRVNLPDWENLYFAGYRMHGTSGVSGFLDLREMYYPEGGYSSSRIRWDRRNAKLRYQRLVRMLERFGASHDGKVILVLSKPFRKELPAGFRKIASFEGAIVEGEDFQVYRWTRAPDPR